MSMVLFPYPQLFSPEDLDFTMDLQLSRVAGQFEKPVSTKDAEIDRDTRSVDLTALQNQYSRLRLEVTLTIPRELVGDLRAADGRVLVVANCKRTNLRKAVRLTSAPEAPHTFTADLDLDFNDLAGIVTLDLTVSGQALGRDHRILGTARPWTLHLDPTTLPFRGGGLAVRWRSFSDDADLQPYKDEPFYLDMTAQPTVLLNSDFEGLPQILPSGRKPSKPLLALHEAELVRIAGATWQAMFESAVAAVRGTEENPTEPDSMWQQAVLRRVLDLVYPSLPPAERLREVRREALTGDSGDLRARALAAISKHILQEGKAMRKALAALGEEMK